MADNKAPEMQATLGLTGLTMNAMALIAPGAFLWLTFAIQGATGATAPAMWFGIIIALLLCLATAVCYAEMAKLYPGTGSSYYFAEQSFLNHDKAWKYARLSKFIVGWGSHLYYWIYPGVMVGVTGVFTGFVVGTLWPNFMSASNPGPMFMMLVAVLFSFGVAYIAYRGVNGSTSVNIAINVIQISALIVFSVLASLGEQSGIFKLFTLGWIIYQAIDANHTARARLTGAPLPNPFGLNDLGERLGFGKTWPVPPPASGTPYPPPPPPTSGSSTFTADPSGNVAYTSQYPGSGPAQPSSGYAAYTAPPTTPAWGAVGATQDPNLPQQPPYTPYASVNSLDPNAPNAAYPPVDPNAYNQSRFPGGAIWLIAIGSIFLIGNLGFFHGFPVRHLVPIFLIGFGIWLFVRKMTFPTPGTDTYNLRVFRALRGSIWIMLIGLLLLLDSFDVLSWSHSWPLFLIAAGAMALFRSTAYSGFANTPYPYAAPAASTPPVTPPPVAPATSVAPVDSAGHDNQEGR